MKFLGKVKSLVIFYYVAKNNSMKNAAKELNLALPTLSQKIKELEITLGEKLFTRHTKSGLKLTEFGEKIFDSAKNILFHIENTEKEITEISSYKTISKKNISIITTKGFASILIIKAISAFHKINPRVDFVINTTDADITTNQFSEDFAISPSIHANKKEYTTTELYRENLSLFASKQYLSTFGEPKNYNDLNHHNFYKFHLSDKQNRGDLDSFFINDRVEKKPLITVNSFLCQLELIKNGEGIAAFPETINKLMNTDLVQLTNFEKTQVKCFITLKKSKQSHIHINEFYEFLKKFSDDHFLS